METRGSNTLVPSKPPKYEDITKTHVIKSPTHLPGSINREGSIDDAASTSGAADPRNPDTLVDLSDPSLEAIVKISKHLADSPITAVSVDDAASTSGAKDPSNQDTLVELSHPSLESVSNLDLSKSIHSGSGSEASGSDALYSVYQFRQPTTLYGKYSKRMRFYRHMGYLLPFEIICLALTIACCFLGAYNWEMCRANVFIPRYLFFNGALATYSLSLHIIDTIWRLVWNSYHFRKYCCAFGMGWMALIATVIEMSEFYTMPYSFHKNEENYCNETFYWFVYYKNIALAVVMPLTAIIYIPTFDYTAYEILNDIL